MSSAAVAVDALALLCLVAASATDSVRAKRALAAAWKSFVRILPAMLLIVVLIGLLLAFVPAAVVALPMEIRALGRKMAFLRNGLSFLAASAIALLMGVILS